MNKKGAILDAAITSLFVMVMLEAIPGHLEVPVQNDAVSAAAPAQDEQRSAEEIGAEFMAML